MVPPMPGVTLAATLVSRGVSLAVALPVTPRGAVARVAAAPVPLTLGGTAMPLTVIGARGVGRRAAASRTGSSRRRLRGLHPVSGRSLVSMRMFRAAVPVVGRPAVTVMAPVSQG